MAGGSYFEVEARVVAPGIVGKIAALIEGPAREIERRLQEAVSRGLSGSGVGARVQGARAGADFADAFSRTMRTRLEAAVRSLPDIKLRADSSDVDRELVKVREELKRILTDDTYRIELGISDRDVEAKLAELRRRLLLLSRNTTDIRVRVNTGTALAELEALKRATSDTGRNGSLFTRLRQDIRDFNPALDGVLSKLGSVGGAVSSIGGNNLVGTLALVSAIVAALSTIGPLVAAAAGGFLGIAGAAGVAGLAVLGLKRQMAQQTGFGLIVSEQFKAISREAQGLGTVAANEIGPALRDVFGLVKAALPNFEALVRIVGGRLGGAFREVGAALVLAFQKAQPLIIEVAGYIEQGATALRDWVASPSFDNFLDYARQELPVVIGYVGDFGKALIDTFVALAPLGEGVLKTLDFVAKGLSAVATKGAGLIGLVSAISPITGLAGAFGKIFGGGDEKKANAASSQIDELLKDVQAFSTGAAISGAQSASLDNYRSIIGDLVPALQLAAVNGAAFGAAVSGIGERLRSANPALQTFMDTAIAYLANTAPTVADTAKLLGDAFTAARGNALDYAAAMVGADTATQGLAKTLHDNIASVSKDGTLLGVSHLDAAGKFVDASNKYSEGSSAIVSSFQAQVKAATDAATATYTNELATKDQATAANDALTVYKGYRQSLIDSSVAAGTARDTAKSLADQYFAVPSDVDTFVKLLGQNDVSIAIQGLTDALNRLSDFIGAPKVTLDPSPVNDAVAGMNHGLDYFGHRVATPTVGINDQATPQVSRIQAAINDLQGKTVTITTYQRTLYSSAASSKQSDIAGALGSAYGNIVKPYAYGGIVDKLRASVPSFAFGSENHVPQIAMPNGGFRIWAEPETQGEAYIPFAQDRRNRAEDILGQVGRRFGMGVIPSQAMRAIAAAGTSRSAPDSGLLGLAVKIDAGSVGTLTGHISAVADRRINTADAAKAHASGAGNSSVVR